ncbi:MAG: C69 family dipeptidase [Bacteroidales bacterium]|nr:C69 family dipeptidase [Bacteroidales bacterium]HOY37793.1 C69 family dipeptidase [Bacteroidales bacterium]HQP03577.1 C69 family dipeptidase [Bacteroidales bacterium]
MKKSVLLFIALVVSLPIFSQDKSDWVAGYPDGCTSITAGKMATTDGSVFTSHTDDSHRTRSEIIIVLGQDYSTGSKMPLYKRIACDTTAMPSYQNIRIGEIPQAKHTYHYINTAYPCMNEFQLGIGESTFGGRDCLQSDAGLIDCQRLCQLILERCKTAREAIILTDALTKEYGWNDYGECLTISDKNEVWHLEIVGPGKGEVGAIWAAQRVPDDHISCNCNASRILEIDLNNKEYFMASDNIFTMARDSAWWNPEKEVFRFAYAYAPESRKSLASRRREWRIFDLLAPSLHLDPNDENYPFSVKPDSLVSIDKLIVVFQDYYEGTPYDMTRCITTTDKDGKTTISPLANPFMPYDELSLHNVSGGWYSTNHDGSIQFLGERTIARWYTMYGTLIQSRSWLPDEIGGVAWIALDNIATSVYVPLYCSITDLPQSYKTPGRTKGYTLQSAWWVFNRLGTLAAQRWGDMRHDVDAAWKPWQKELIRNQNNIDKFAQNMKSTKKRVEFLTQYSNDQANKAVTKAIELGDFLWTKYDEKF